MALIFVTGDSRLENQAMLVLQSSSCLVSVKQWGVWCSVVHWQHECKSFVLFSNRMLGLQTGWSTSPLCLKAVWKVQESFFGREWSILRSHHSYIVVFCSLVTLMSIKQLSKEVSRWWQWWKSNIKHWVNIVVCKWVVHSCTIPVIKTFCPLHVLSVYNSKQCHIVVLSLRMIQSCRIHRMVQ